MATPLSVILTKRDNERPHPKEEIEYFIDAFTTGEVKDFQMTAWMAVICLNGMTDMETAHLTSAMVRSGEVMDWTSVEGVTADKHSTGGVGDKISIILAPLVASFGVKVPMMAGRGLGHTGGTIDKLESIPGFRTDLSMTEFSDNVSRIGAAIIAPGGSMVLADKRMYALRDVTGTVTSLPLQTSSIMSKKLAENPDSLVLDVKFGRSAFQKTSKESIELAKSLIAAGELGGVKVGAFVTRMDCPIGAAVGNWLEVKECIHILRSGRGFEDLINLCIVEAAQMLVQSGAVPSNSLSEGIDMARRNLSNGRAFDKFRSMVVAQGGDVSVVEHLESHPQKPIFEIDICVDAEGRRYLSGIDALEVGYTAIDIRADRTSPDSEIDMTAGIWFYKKVGDQVEAGDKVATIYDKESCC